MGKYAQFDEEEKIEEIFSKIGTTNKFFVEIGCHEIPLISNTCLLKEQGWIGHWIDQEEHPAIIQERITAENINEVLEKYNVPDKPDLLSLDIDGMDYWIWKALKMKPRVVIIEYNSQRESGVWEYDPEYRMGEKPIPGYYLQYGASKDEMVKLGKEKGYKLYYANSDNLFFYENST
jgi:hypothetical protein